MSSSELRSETPYARNFRTAKSTISMGEPEADSSIILNEATPSTLKHSEGPLPRLVPRCLPVNGSGDMSRPKNTNGPMSSSRVSSERPLPQRTLNYNSDGSTPSWRMEKVRPKLAGPRATKDSSNSNREARDSGAELLSGPHINKDDEVHWQTQVLMSVMWYGGKLSVAYYEVESAHLYMMPDTVEGDDFALLKKVLSHLNPDLVVVSTKIDDRLLNLLKETRVDPVDKLHSSMKMLPSMDFGLDVCKQRLLLLELPCIPSNLTPNERTLFLCSMIPFEYETMIRAVGGLLRYLDKNRVGIELEDLDARVPVLSTHLFSLADMVLIDDNTYRALHIFNKEDHPSVYKSGMSHAAKEGFSLFGRRLVTAERDLKNCCQKDQLRPVMGQWFMRPSRNLNLLQERHSAVAFFSHPMNTQICLDLHSALKDVKNINRAILRMTQSQATMGDWHGLYKTTFSAIYIGELCRTLTEHGIAIINKISENFTEDLHRIANMMKKVIDFEESAILNRFSVKPGVDEELDKKKRTYNGLPELMTQVAREELNRLEEDVSTCTVVYLPQLGYLLAIPENADLTEETNYEIPGLEFVFLSNNTLHYRSASTKELDSYLGDIQLEIVDQETQIMHNLQNAILDHVQVLLEVMLYSAELDCLITLALFAREGNYVRPEMKKDSVIQIRGGRHPLQELCCSPFVPNDTYSGGKEGKIKVLTGPNACGKSVYIKQVGIIIFMAHIGSFLPADSATIGLVDAIYTRIQTLDSVSVGLSTFMIDLNQVTHAIRGATHQSLVLLDEFGKGTQTDDGVALLCACLRYWMNQNNKCPHILVTTHFHSLITQNLLPESNQLTYQTMDVLQDGGDLVFLYQLKEGSTLASHACHIASLADIPSSIVKRAMQVTDLIRRHQPIPKANLADKADQNDATSS